MNHPVLSGRVRLDLSSAFCRGRSVLDQRAMWRVGLVVLVLSVSFAEADWPILLQETGSTQPRSSTGPSIPADQLIAQLDDSDVRMREEATITLLQDADAISLGEIEQRLKRGGLSTEQQLRLLRVGQERFMNSPRGALGVRFHRPQSLESIIIVRDAIAGFASADFLQRGDVIVEADGVRIRGSDAFRKIRSQIISHDPGQAVHLVIRRGAQRLEVDVPLGSFAELNGSYLGMSQVHRAWQARKASFITMPEPIKPVLVGDQAGQAVVWQRPVSAPIAEQDQMPMLHAQGDNELWLMQHSQFEPFVGGGMPRQSAFIADVNAPELRQLRVGQGQVIIFRGNRVIRNDPRLGFAPIDFPDDPVAPELTPQQELDLIDQRIEHFKAIVEIQQSAGNGDENAGNDRAKGIVPKVVAQELDPLSPTEELELLRLVRAALEAELEERDSSSQVQSPTASDRTAN